MGLGGEVEFAELVIVELLDELWLEEFYEALTIAHMDTMGDREGLMVVFVNGDGADDAVLAKVVVLGNPVVNSTPLGVDVVVFNTPVNIELDVMFRKPVDRDIPADGENVTLDIPVERGMRELYGNDVVFK